MGFDRWVITGVYEGRQCPRRLVTTRSAYLLDLYHLYRAGHLLETGGVSAQPNLYLDAMRLIGAVVESEHGRSPRTN